MFVFRSSFASASFTRLAHVTFPIWRALCAQRSDVRSLSLPAASLSRFLTLATFEVGLWIGTILVWARTAPHAAKHGQDRDEDSEGYHPHLLGPSEVRNFIEN